MTEDQITKYFQRIDSLTLTQRPKFGTMNANQMICHCADQIRMALGSIEIGAYDTIKPEKVIELVQSRKTVPTPKGLDQVSGGGTLPTNFENDKKVLKQHISDFSKLEDTFDFKPHPYFGSYGKKQWVQLTIYHLDHHLKQFNV